MLGLGVVSVLVVAGISLAGVLPAGAVTPAVLTFGTLPSSGTAGSALTSFDVTYTGGNSTSDTIQISSSCTLGSGTFSMAASSSSATFSDVVLNGAGSCTLTANDTSASGSVTSSAILIAPAAPSKVVFSTTPAATGAWGAPLPTFAVSVEDQYGNVETSGHTGSTDTIAITSSNPGTCPLNGTSVSVAAANGVATFTNDVDFNSGTPCQLVATDSTTSISTATSAAIALVSDTPTEIAFSTEPSGTPTAGTALSPFAVSVEVSNGGRSNYGDTITLTSTCKLAGTTSVAASSGVATFSDVIIDSTGACYLTATDASRTLATATSSLVNVEPGTPTHLAFVTPPPATVNGTGIALTTFVVAVEDAYNNVVTTGTGSTDSILLSSTCGLSGTTTVAASGGGEASFTNISFTSTGTCTLTATDETRTITVATATTSVGEPEAALLLSTTTGYLDSPLSLATKGGSGTGAVTYTVTNGTASGCAITGNTLKATTAGTCLVTATKAAASPYASATTGAVTVTISSSPKALRLVGALTIGRTATVSISGYNFSGRPKAISNVAGFSALVTRDTGKLLTLRITVKASATRPGVKTMTLIFANGKRTSFKYSLH